MVLYYLQVLVAIQPHNNTAQSFRS